MGTKLYHCMFYFRTISFSQIWCFGPETILLKKENTVCKNDNIIWDQKTKQTRDMKLDPTSASSEIAVSALLIGTVIFPCWHRLGGFFYKNI